MKTNLFISNLFIMLFFTLTLNTFAQTELIQNGNFSSGYSNWSTSGNWFISNSYSCYNSASGFAYAGNASGNPVINQYGNLKQSITIPNNATSATFSFYASQNTQETTTTTSYDFIEVYFWTPSNNWLTTFIHLSNLSAATYPGCQSYGLHTYDVSAYIGQTIQVVFHVFSDGGPKNTLFRIDDVSLTYTGNCSNYASTPPSASFNSNSNSGTFEVSASGTNCNYSVMSNCSWITATAGNYGVASYFIDANSTCNTRQGTISVLDGNGVVQPSATFSVSQSGLSTASTPIISGNTSICSGQSTTLNVTNPCSNCNYNWSNGGSGTSISVNTAGVYSAIASNSCGSSSPSNSLNVTVNPIPTTPIISALGGTSICQGSSTTLQVTNSGSCSGCSYTWYPSGNGTSINVTSAGTYYCTSSNSCPGNSSPSNSIQITVTPSPVTPVISAQGGITSFCQGAGSATLQVANSGSCSGCNYSWYPSGTGTSITAASAGTYYCTASNTCPGTSPPSNSISIIVNTSPSASFSYINNGLNFNFSDNSTGLPTYWHWDFGDFNSINNTSILQNSQHTFTGSGAYNVSLQVSNTCGSNTTFQNIVIVGIEDNIKDINNISIYPNPISNSAQLNFTVTKKGLISIYLYDILGNKINTISESNLNSGDYSISFNRPNKLSPGIYFVKYISEKFSSSQKVVFK